VGVDVANAESVQLVACDEAHYLGVGGCVGLRQILQGHQDDLPPQSLQEKHVSIAIPPLTTIAIEFADGIAEIRLNRPERSNAMNEAMWQELRTAFDWADATAEVRVAILSGAGRNFCAGIDLAMLAGVGQAVAHRDPARSREALRRLILDLQDCLSTVERCRKPVLAAIQGACIGGAIDLVTCCDMRYAAAEVQFSVREIDVGMTADVGTLQRLPRLIPDGVARELAYTGRRSMAPRRRRSGSSIRSTRPPRRCSTGFADRPPHRREIAAGHPRQQGDAQLRPRPFGGRWLNYVATWNAAMLISADLDETLTAMREQRPPRFLD
jgi:enoyl-CoA hydratase